MLIGDSRRVNFKVKGEIFRISPHNILEVSENFQSTGPSLVDLTLIANSRQGENSITLLTKMSNDVILILDSIVHLEVSFENLSKKHLNGPDHTAPAIVSLDRLDAFSIGEPKGSSEDKQKLIGLFIAITLTQEFCFGPTFQYFDFFSTAHVRMFN